MPRKRFPPTDPREWLNRARGNLAIAQAVIPDAWLEDLCFEAQQCVEKALKGIFVAHKQSFPYVHDLRKLLQLLEQHGVKIPKYVWAADDLSDYAVITRYPDVVGPVSRRQYRRAVRIAEKVLHWAERQVDSSTQKSEGKK